MSTPGPHDDRERATPTAAEWLERWCAWHEALVTRQPINFTAAMCKVPNMLPSKRAEIRDSHLEAVRKALFRLKKQIRSCVETSLREAQ